MQVLGGSFGGQVALASQLTGRYRSWQRTLRERYFRPYVFIHINKTGGSSIEKALGIRLDHSTALEKYAELGAEAWNNKYKFTFVRNPWDKVVSHYHYRVLTNQTGLKENGVNFDDWLKLCYVERDPQYYDQEKMFQPQIQWLVDKEGCLLVDFVGRFENLAEDFQTISATMGIHCELGHAKQSQRSSYRDYYSDAGRDLIGEIFCEDISLFDYQF